MLAQVNVVSKLSIDHKRLKNGLHVNINLYILHNLVRIQFVIAFISQYDRP